MGERNKRGKVLYPKATPTKSQEGPVPQQTGRGRRALSPSLHGQLGHRYYFKEGTPAAPSFIHAPKGLWLQALGRGRKMRRRSSTT